MKVCLGVGRIKVGVIAKEVSENVSEVKESFYTIHSECHGASTRHLRYMNVLV